MTNKTDYRPLPFEIAVFRFIAGCVAGGILASVAIALGGALWEAFA